MKSKLSLKQLKVKSFITSTEQSKVLGGATMPQCSGVIQCHTGLTQRLCETLPLECL